MLLLQALLLSLVCLGREVLQLAALALKVVLAKDLVATLFSY